LKIDITSNATRYWPIVEEKNLWVLENLFWISIAIIILTLIVSRPFLAPSKYRPSYAKKINLAYAIGFFVMIYGWGIFTMDYGIQSGWIEIVGYIIIVMLGLGALLENKRDFPLLRKEILAALEQAKQDEPDTYYEFLLHVEDVGLAEALQKFNLT